MNEISGEKKRVLFVDDHPEVLEGLRRMLHKLRSEWEMEFADTGEEALAKMEEKTFDVVISDMKMPVMNGAQLLKKVSEKYPGTVRFILSGHSDRELTMQAVGYAHRYLAKPFEPDDLKILLNKSVGLRQLLSNQKLHEKIATISSLPSPPQVYRQLVTELQSENASTKKVAELIAKDVSLTAKLLQMVNSAFFGLPTRVDSPIQAVNLLGLDTVAGLVLTAGVFNEFDEPALQGISIESIYSHSMAVGCSARRIAKILSLPQTQIDDSFMAGMLHDIGKVIMLAHFRDNLAASIKLAAEESIPQHLAEARVLGVCHAGIGAHLLSLWGLPDSILEAVAMHHSPNSSPHPVKSVLTAVHVANAGAYIIDSLAGNTSERLDIGYLTELGLTDELPNLIGLSRAETV